MIKTEKYPVFKPNQVLSDGQLNKILTYLEPQDRVTRTLGIGRGVLCGFELQIVAGAVVLVPGIGMTSTGFIFSTPTAIQFTHCLPFTPTDQYAPFLAANGTDHIALLTLVEKDVPDDPTCMALTDLVLEEYVVALFANEYEFDLTTCLPENCDNQGGEQRIEWQLLLLKRDDALEILRSDDSRLASATDEAAVTAVVQAKYELQKLKLQRPLLSAGNVVKYSTMTRVYRDVCRTELTRFTKALSAAYSCYEPLVGKENMSRVLDKLYGHFIKLGDGRGLQYFWDYLDDLFHAYNEFIDEAFLLTSACGIAGASFSHHLFLGPAENLTSCRPTIFRHYFTPACEEYSHGDQPGNVKTLFQRLIDLINGFSWKPSIETLRITPQLLGHNFEGRAIPHYLRHEQVKENWSVAAKQRCQQDAIASWHREDDAILQENLVDYNHLRIEGHMYRPKEEVLKELDTLRTTYNLPFQVKSLELGNVPELDSGGCGIGSLRILYEITRLDILCFVEDKIRFLNSIVADDLEFESDEEESEERIKERKLTRIEDSKKHDFLEVIDFSRNKVFATQKRRSKTVPGMTLPGNSDAFNADSMEPGAARALPDMLLKTKTTTPYVGRKQSRYEKDFDYEELEKVEVPKGIKTIIERSPSTSQMLKAGEFAVEFAPQAATGKKETPVKEDSISFTIEAMDVAFAFPKTPIADYIKYDKDELGDRLLSELLGNLMKLLEELPEEVHFFDDDDVREVCAVIKDKALSLKDIVEELLGSEDYVPRGVEYALIAELLELADACIEKRLGRIAEMHSDEWQAAENSSVLADYIKKHPSIHHCGGVHIGGTHVLVSGHIDKVREIRKIRKLTQPLFVKAPLAVYQNLRGNVYENVLRTAGHFNRKAFTWSKRIDKERIIQKLPGKIDLTPSITLDRKRNVLLDGLLRRIESSTEEEAILFDFCHQYICCSECSSVEYVVIAELKIYLPKLSFCHDDSDNYAFAVYPPGGVVTGSGVKKIGETYYFYPATASVGEQIFTYTMGGRDIQLVASVATAPQSRFSYVIKELVVGENGVSTAAIVQFANLSANADSYHWDFGDGRSSTDNSPSHTFDISGENSFKVVLTAMNDACRDATDQELNLVQVSFHIEKHLTEFCNTDETAYDLITVPADGTFTPNDAIDVETRSWHPGRVNLAGAGQQSVELFYEHGQQLVPLTVEVYAMPQPRFSYEILESDSQAVLVRFRNESIHGSSYVWDFGDGEKSNRLDPTHKYNLESGTSFSVVLFASNGPCETSSAPEVLSFSQLRLEFGGESDGNFCETDKEGVELIGTPAGGKFFGPGVTENRFIPSAVTMGTLGRKTVTLQYDTGAQPATLLAVVHKRPVLDFSTSASSAGAGTNVRFTNLSTFADEYIWEFGDGSDKASGRNVSHVYEKPSAYQVILRGINTSCENVLTRSVVVKETSGEMETIPVRPLTGLTKMLESAKVRDLLVEFSVNGASLQFFYLEMAKIVRSARKEEIVAFAMNDERFIDPVQEITTLGEQVLKSGGRLGENSLQVLIDVYRLSIANILNMQSQRSADLDGRSKLNAVLKQLLELTAAFNEKINFEKFPAESFELVPQEWFRDMKNLQGLYVEFGNSL